MVRRSKLILLLAIVLTIGACKKAADLAKYKDQAMALVDQYGPTVKELGGKLGGLRERVKSLPTNLPVVGGRSLGSLLRGGTGNCMSGSDKDTNNGVVGWWFYLNYTATVRPWTD